MKWTDKVDRRGFLQVLGVASLSSKLIGCGSSSTKPEEEDNGSDSGSVYSIDTKILECEPVYNAGGVPRYLRVKVRAIPSDGVIHTVFMQSYDGVNFNSNLGGSVQSESENEIIAHVYFNDGPGHPEDPHASIGEHEYWIMAVGRTSDWKIVKDPSPASKRYVIEDF